jgi:hypothetical protein
LVREEGNGLKALSRFPRNYGCRLTEFTHQGYPTLTLENESLRVTVLAGKGSDIIQFLYKPADLDFLWISLPGLQPAGVRAGPHMGPTHAFLDSYPGGWQEILPNFGDPCDYKGITLGLHDETSLLPWQYSVLVDEPTLVSVLFEVRCIRTPFRLQKTLTLRPGRVLEIDERLINESAETVDFTWGHHPAFGAPFLDNTCRVLVPPCRVKTQEEYVSPNSRLEKGQDCEWPRVPGRKGETIDLSRVAPPSAHSHDMAYLYGFQEGLYALFSDIRKIGFGMAWDCSVFKYLWFWQVYAGWVGYPWYGASYNVGLEPCSSYPSSLARAIERGTQLKLEPGASFGTRVCAAAIRDIGEFADMTRPTVSQAVCPFGN